MRVVDEINKLVKKAQAFVKFYPDDVYRDGAKNIINTVKKVPNALWGTLGVGAGLAKGVADRKWRIPFAPMAGVPSPMVEVGKGKPEGSWGDYARAGWDTGYNHGDMGAAGLIEGMAKGIPFTNFEAPSRFADFIQKEKIDDGMDPEVANTMRRRANYAGYGVDLLPTMAAWGLMGRGLGGGVAQIAQKAGASERVASVAGKSVPYAIDAWLFKDIPISLYENLAPWSQTNKTKERLSNLYELARQSEDARQRAEVVPLTDEERTRRRKEYEDIRKRMY